MSRQMAEVGAIKTTKKQETIGFHPPLNLPIFRKNPGLYGDRKVIKGETISSI